VGAPIGMPGDVEGGDVIVRDRTKVRLQALRQNDPSDMDTGDLERATLRTTV